MARVAGGKAAAMRKCTFFALCTVVGTWMCPFSVQNVLNLICNRHCFSPMSCLFSVDVFMANSCCIYKGSSEGTVMIGLVTSRGYCLSVVQTRLFLFMASTRQ